MAVAEKYGQLPDTVEREMSTFWFNRTVLMMDAETLDQRRRDAEREREQRRK